MRGADEVTGRAPHAVHPGTPHRVDGEPRPGTALRPATLRTPDEQCLAAEWTECLGKLDAETRTRHSAVLGAAARRELLQKRLPGSAWAESRGCGIRIESPEPGESSGAGFACGAGHVPERAQRFLYFFTEPPK